MNTPGLPTATTVGSAGKAAVVPEEKSTVPDAILARTRVTPFGSEAAPTSGKVAFWKVPRLGAEKEAPGLVRERRKGTTKGEAMVLPGLSTAPMAIWYFPSGSPSPVELK